VRLRRPKPSPGDRRVAVGFALFPCHCDDGVLVWFGRFWWVERCYRHSRSGELLWDPVDHRTWSTRSAAEAALAEGRA
jgi:hypothetical protein